MPKRGDRKNKYPANKNLSRGFNFKGGFQPADRVFRASWLARHSSQDRILCKRPFGPPPGSPEAALKRALNIDPKLHESADVKRLRWDLNKVQGHE
jgi:hypothetical protein